MTDGLAEDLEWVCQAYIATSVVTPAVFDHAAATVLHISLLVAPTQPAQNGSPPK